MWSTPQRLIRTIHGDQCPKVVLFSYAILRHPFVCFSTLLFMARRRSVAYSSHHLLGPHLRSRPSSLRLDLTSNAPNFAFSQGHKSPSILWATSFQYSRRSAHEQCVSFQCKRHVFRSSQRTLSRVVLRDAAMEQRKNLPLLTGYQ